MQIDYLPEYNRDFKKLAKRYRTLESDMADVIKILKIRPNAQPPFSYEITGLGLKTCVIKVKKIASDSFKGRGVNSGLRLIYAHFPNEQKITFIELYHKNDKENEDRERIRGNFE
jgi:mRNA-degrading endonuclease RelE of RelBE toxin-antitoxin system